MPKFLIEDPSGNASATIGGRPLAPTNFVWPQCRTCSGPMAFVAQIPLRECEEPSIRRDDTCLLLFQCQNDPGMCEEWDANGGGNAAFLVPERERVSIVVPEGNTLLAAESRLKFAPSEPKAGETAVDAYCEALDAPDSHVIGRMGGNPFWIQGDETPTCDCGTKMTFVCQIEESAGGGINFGGGGCAYAFLCSKCPKSARFLWQN